MSANKTADSSASTVTTALHSFTSTSLTRFVDQHAAMAHTLMAKIALTAMLHVPHVMVPLRMTVNHACKPAH